MDLLYRFAVLGSHFTELGVLFWYVSYKHCESARLLFFVMLCAKFSFLLAQHKKKYILIWILGFSWFLSHPKMFYHLTDKCVVFLGY